MTNPEYLGPQPIEALSVEEFARAEIAHHITAPDTIDPQRSGTDYSSEARKRFVKSRNTFFEAIGMPSPSDLSNELTPLTKNVIGHNPELVTEVRKEISALLGAQAVNAMTALLLQTDAERLKATEPARMQHLQYLTDLDHLTKRLHRAGLAAEPIGCLGFIAGADESINNKGYWTTYLNYEGTQRFA